ncbi:MAG: Uma2 family endonuclease [Hamadaea sp.]|uniref:Uma2 family endonuclease n=1 Tax=Hamadaea sp. TaxID=2024425 RepID=UPI001793969B|nr:Uma2 family endonuclease [Hamadaea sp.]NUT23776.1 Uma2 family endonuclease [Hamadaea sp.]
MSSIAGFVEKLAGPHWWTAADYPDLPEELRCEIYLGGLRVVPAGSISHKVVSVELAESLRAAASDPWSVGRSIPVHAEDQIFLPDVLVFRGDVGALPVSAVNVGLVVEVIDQENIERTVKMRAYAAAGIPAYLILDGEPGKRRAEVYGLVEGKYERTAFAAFDVPLSVEAPFSFVIDMSKINT